jgi:hypothetical protein
LPEVLKSTFITLQNMKKCRYIPESGLPPLGDAGTVEVMLAAFREGRVKVLNRAIGCLTGCWHISVDVFVEAILDHLETGGRAFKKYEKAGARLLPNKYQASVWIREPDDDDDYDDGTVYVELLVTDNEVILICNTHEHENGGRNLRLPY